MKHKLLASLATLLLLVPSVPASAGSAELWNATKQTVVMTTCAISRAGIPLDCDDRVFKGGEYTTLQCTRTRTCSVSVKPAGKIRFQKVLYTDGMGVTLDVYELHAFDPASAKN
jgi:hypothetical protein